MTPEHANSIEGLRLYAADLHMTLMRWADQTENDLHNPAISSLPQSDLIKAMACINLARGSLTVVQLLLTKLTDDPVDSSDVEDELCNICLTLASRRKTEIKEKAESNKTTPTNDPPPTEEPSNDH